MPNDDSRIRRYNPPDSYYLARSRDSVYHVFAPFGGKVDGEHPFYQRIYTTTIRSVACAYAWEHKRLLEEQREQNAERYLRRISAGTPASSVSSS